MTFTSHSKFADSITLRKVTAQTNSSTSISLDDNMIQISAPHVKLNGIVVATISDVATVFNNIESSSISYDSSSNIQIAINSLAMITQNITGAGDYTEFTSEVAMSGNCITSNKDPTKESHMATKGYSDIVGGRSVTLNDATNGSGTSLISNATAPNFKLKSLKAGNTGITVEETQDGKVSITNNTTITSLGSGTSVINTTSLAPTFQLYGLSAGNAGITVGSASGGAIPVYNNTTVTCPVFAPAVSLIATNSAAPAFRLNSLNSGTGIKIDMPSSGTITINALQRAYACTYFDSNTKWTTLNTDVAKDIDIQSPEIFIQGHRSGEMSIDEICGKISFTFKESSYLLVYYSVSLYHKDPEKKDRNIRFVLLQSDVTKNRVYTVYGLPYEQSYNFSGNFIMNVDSLAGISGYIHPRVGLADNMGVLDIMVDSISISVVQVA